MAFPSSALYKTRHLATERADQRQIEHRHALLCAAQGIEHQQQPNSISHDVTLPEDPTTTLRIVTSTDKKTAITGYYLPTAEAVKHREASAQKRQEQEAAAKQGRTAAVASQAKASSNKADQKNKQLIRQHPLTHDKKPDAKCPLCNPKS